MKACGVKGTNQGLVTTYKTFIPNLYTIYNRFTFKEQDEVRYNTHSNRFVSIINFCTAVKIDVFVFIESELS